MNSTQTPVVVSTILDISSKYSFYINCIIFNVGLLGNFLNILVFTHLKFFRENRCIFYLIIETISNMTYEFGSLIPLIIKFIYGSKAINFSLFWCRLSYILGLSCGLITYSMICCAAADQFFSTNYHFNLRQMCTLKLARYMAVIVTIIWLVNGIVLSFFCNIVGSSGCIISNPILVDYLTFFFFPVLASSLPVIIALFFSLSAYRNVRRIVRRQVPIQRRRLDRQITAMILIHVAFFVFSTVPFIVYRIYVINITQSSMSSLSIAILQLSQQIITSIYNLNFAVSSIFCFVFYTSKFIELL